ncbi:soluble lamin-associated protein of 75 kDa-like isoform X4 [Hemiscyllium ocellatum]|nr:soluble lamin-associated protein of 75 kDa-like isoform X4 [Hemiscyllium ocellatum]
MSADELPFLCHSATEYAKILWKSGKAIGFYSTKIAGSKCDTFLTQRYQLPILDTIFVRKKHRGKGYGLQMLEDFVDSFTEDMLGLRYPLSPSMFGVCRKYLNNYPDDHSLLWEVEGVGHPFQRVRIADRLLTQIAPVKGIDISHTDEHGPVKEESSSLDLTESGTANQLTNKVEKQPHMTELPTELLARQALPGASSILSEELTRPPVAKRGRSGQSKRSKAAKCRVESETKSKRFNNKEEASASAEVKDQLNRCEAKVDGSGDAPQMIGNQEKCIIPEGPAGIMESDVDILKQDVGEDKESSSETIPESVNLEMREQVVQDSSKSAEMIPEEPVKVEEAIPKDPSDAAEEIPKNPAIVEDEIPKNLAKAEEGIANNPTKAEEDIPEDPAKTEEEMEEEIPPELTKADEEIPEAPIEAEEEIPEDAIKVEVEIPPESVKPEREIAQDTVSDKEEVIQDSTNIDREVNEAANGAPSDQLENVPEEPSPEEDLKDHSEGNMTEKAAELEEESAEVVLAQNEGKECEPVQGPAVNSCPPNHHAPIPNKPALAEIGELPDVQANAKTSDNSHVSVNEEVSQHSALEGEGISETATAQPESETGESNAPMDLSLGPLLVIELEDVSLKQVSSVQLSEDETKESDDLKDQSSPAVVEKAADSSSEEMETEVPVVDRRNLRRKVKANKGPPKKRSKVRHNRASTRTR